MNVKDAILHAGVALLEEKGIAALTQPQVARAAGVKQSHLTYYFPTRTDLLLGIAEQSIDAAMQSVSAQLAARPKTSALAATIADVVIKGLPPRVIIGLIVAADAEPDIRMHLRKLIKQVRGQIGILLARAGLPATRDAVLLFHATIVGLAVMHQARLNADSVREVKTGIAAMLRVLAASAQGG